MAAVSFRGRLQSIKYCAAPAAAVATYVGHGNPRRASPMGIGVLLCARGADCESTQERMCVGCLNSALPHQTILHTTTLKKRSGQSNGAVIWVSRCAGGRHAVVVAIATWVIALHVAMGDTCNERVWQHLLHARRVRPQLKTCAFPTIRTLIMAISR